MTGNNKEKEILALGDKEMWNARMPHKQTFFSKFKNPKIIDLPGYSYELEQHAKERELLKRFFNSNNLDEKEVIKKEYNQLALEHHKKIKKEFEEALLHDYDLVVGYFSAADVLGHLNFGNKFLMKMIYKDFDELAGKIKADKLIVLSDHGMKSIGQFGDHSEYGFWSANFKTGLKNPRITEFYKAITSLIKQ
jgi:hypothetical protein